MKRLRFLLLLSLVGVLSYGCIQTPAPEFPKRISYLINVDNVGDTLNTGQNSLYISEFKLLADKFHVLLPDERVVQSRAEGLIMGYRDSNNGDDNLVVRANIGYEDLSIFNGLELFIAPPENSSIRDDEFYGGENNYSLVIKGSYNDSNFRYRSDPNFVKNIEFPQVELTESKQTLVLRMLMDVEKIMTNQQGELIDPGNQENKARIDSLVQENISIEAFAINGVFEEPQ